MKIRFLLIGTNLSLIPQTINAQCVATQDCATLGYTETSCAGGSGVKCPFGNKWACFKSESEYEQQFCDKYGFTLSCTGTNQTGGAGKACGGKYTACICASGYEWKDGSCQEIINGVQGDLYYCNNAVVGVKVSGMNFYVAMKDLGKMTWNSADSSCKRYVFCDNIYGILPSDMQLQTIYNNKSTINSLLSTNGGTQLAEGTYWSSTHNYSNNYILLYMVNGIMDGQRSDYSTNVRPILTSW